MSEKSFENHSIIRKSFENHSINHRIRNRITYSFVGFTFNAGTDHESFLANGDGSCTRHREEGQRIRVLEEEKIANSQLFRPLLNNSIL